MKGPVISEPPDVIELVEAFDVVRHSVSLQHVLALRDGGDSVDLQVWKQRKLRKTQERQSERERKRVTRRRCCRLKRTGILQWPGRTWGNRRHAHREDGHTCSQVKRLCGQLSCDIFRFHKSGHWPHTLFIYIHVETITCQGYINRGQNNKARMAHNATHQGNKWDQKQQLLTDQ